MSGQHTGRGGTATEPQLIAVEPDRSRTWRLTRANSLERMTGIEPALSAWEAAEPASHEVSQPQTWSFEAQLVAFLYESGPVGGREVDQDGHRPTSRRRSCSVSRRRPSADARLHPFAPLANGGESALAESPVDESDPNEAECASSACRQETIQLGNCGAQISAWPGLGRGRGNADHDDVGIGRRRCGLTSPPR